MKILYLVHVVVFMFLAIVIGGQQAEAQTKIVSDQVVTDSVQTLNWKYFEISAQSGHTELIVETGGDGDIDLYIKKGSLPSRIDFDCRAVKAGSEESCVKSNNTNGIWFIGVYGFKTSNFVISAKLRPILSDTLPPINPVPSGPSVSSLAPVISLLLDESTGDQPLPLSQLDYTLRATCANYQNITSYADGRQFLGNGSRDGNLDTPEIIEIDLVADDGRVIRPNIFSLDDPWGVGSPGSGNHSVPQYPVGFPSGGDQSLRTLMRNNLEHNLLIRCVHLSFQGNKRQEFNMFVPLKARALWLKSLHLGSDRDVMNDVLLHISMLSDLRYKIYLKLVQSGLDQGDALLRSKAFLDETFTEFVFEEVKFSEHTNNTGQLYFQLFSAMASEQSPVYWLFKFVADELTDGRVDLLNDLIAAQYAEFLLNQNAVCADAIVCASFFKGKSESLTTNSEFQQNLTAWQTQSVSNSDSVGSIQVVRSRTSLLPAANNSPDNSVLIELESNHPNSENSASEHVFKVATVSSFSEIQKMVLTFSFEELFGTCRLIGGCFASGYAGVFVCFEDQNSLTIGCATGGSFNDSITIPTLVGNVFQVDSSDGVYIIPRVPEKPFIGSFSLGYIAEKIPTVRANKSLVKQVSYGLYVGEATGVGFCFACEARGRLDMMRLSKVD